MLLGMFLLSIVIVSSTGPRHLRSPLNASPADIDRLRPAQNAGITVIAKDEIPFLFRQSKEQRVSMAACEALGRVGAGEAMVEFEGILAGPQKVGEWNNGETEHAWYLLKALYAPGETDLAPQSAKLSVNNRPRLDDLMKFLAMGKIPPLSAKLEQGLSKARQNVQ